MNRRIAITGIGVISVLGDNPKRLQQALCAGGPGLTRRALPAPGGTAEFLCGAIDDFVVKQYFGNVNIRPFNRTARLLIAAAHSALESSGCGPASHQDREIALVVGTMYCSIRTISEFDRRALTAGPAYVSPMDFANTVINAAAGQTAIWHKLRGSNVTVTGGAAAGLQAMAHGADLIRNGTAAFVLAGGVEELCFESLFTFQRAGYLSRKLGPAPFDLDRDGTALSEAAAAFMLEEYSAAEARGATIFGEIVGTGMAFDSSGGRDQKRAANAVCRSVTEALNNAEMTAADIGCVSAAAGGFINGDLNEAHGLEAALNGEASHVPVTAIKAIVGDSLGASGPLAALSMLHTLRDGVIPGIRHLRTPDPACPLRNITPETRTVAVAAGLVNALSLDGQCCSLILKRARVAA